jgi:transcriptional regulator NrdR family protein
MNRPVNAERKSAAMRCPLCHSGRLSVEDSRHRDGFVYRRRECRDCGHRFSTIEIPMADWDRCQQGKQVVARLRAALDALDDPVGES